MAISQNDLMLDAALSTIRENVDMITVCAGQPITFDSAITQGGQMLARVLVSAAGFAALADGDTSGRKLTINTHAAIPVSATGGANHIALVNTSSSVLWYVTTATSQQLTSGNTVTTNGWDIEIADGA